MPVLIEGAVAAIGRIDVVPTILDVVCRTTGMRFAAVARVTQDRWIACAVHDRIDFGLIPGGELEIATTICNQIRATGESVAIDHVAEDQVFSGHPTPKMYGFESYISVPIRTPDGAFFGTLCAIDPAPAKVSSPEVVGMFTLFADLIGFHLHAQDRLKATEAALLDARQQSELRDQFIAVLGHDLRNSVASVGGASRLLSRDPSPSKVSQIASLLQSSAARMAELIDNVLDFARGRLGGGITLTLTGTESLSAALDQVVDEVRSAWPDRAIECRLDISGNVSCDSARIAQLFSNLLSNAVSHGARDKPILVEAETSGGAFRLSVANGGKPIPPETLERLFQPYYRASKSSGKQGLGLGLYISSEIAKAHGGTLSVTSTADETRFTMEIPG